VGAVELELIAPVARASLPRTVLTATLTIVAVAVTLYVLWLLRRPISWIVLATFLAVVLTGPVTRLNRHMPRGLSIALTYLGVLLIPVGIVAIVVPPLLREGANLVDALPSYAADFDEWVNSSERLRSLDEDFDITGTLEKEAAQLPARAGDAATWLGDLGLGVVNSAFAAVTILLLSVFLVANGRRWIELVLALQPVERAGRLRRVLQEMGDAIGAYVAGALAQAAIAGLLTFIVLTVLGVPFAAPLALIVALFDLIPMVGATIAAVFVGVITLFADFPTDTIVWTIWSIVYQQLENNLIQPRIQERAVGVHPFVVIVSVLFGSTLFGVPGALLAVPVAASIQIALLEWWRMRSTPIVAPAEDVGPAGVGPA
jgi:predicted PurR-regulated permease PerM